MSHDEIRIFVIKKNGKLMGMEDSWQYWLYNGVVYSISTDGTRYSVWCAENVLRPHLVRLQQLTGKYFPDTLYSVNADLWPKI